MGLYINTNTNAMSVQRSLTSASGDVSQSIQRLSTGYKINKAADDAAGLTISQSLESQARGSKVATDNAQNGINLLQTAEGDLGVIQDNLQRIRDLSVQAANGTNATAERNAIKSEVDQRVNEINRLSGSSAFNAIKLLNGSSTTLTLQIGANYDPKAISLNSITLKTATGTVSPLSNANASSLGITVGTAFTSSAHAASYISKIDKAIATVSERRSTIGSLQNRLDSALSSLSVRTQNITASEARIMDTDVATEASQLTKSQILQQASTTLLAQANQAPSSALSLI